MATIQLQSSDGKQFTVAMEIAKKSVTIKTMLEDLGFESGEGDQEPGMFIFSKIPAPMPTISGDRKLTSG